MLDLVVFNQRIYQIAGHIATLFIHRFQENRRRERMQLYDERRTQIEAPFTRNVPLLGRSVLTEPSTNENTAGVPIGRKNQPIKVV